MNPCRNAVMAIGVLFCCGGICLSACAQDFDPASTEVTGDTVLTNDKTGQVRPAVSDAVDAPIPSVFGDTAVLAQQKPAETEENKAEPLKLVKRTYGKKQVLLATVMMIFVIAIMTAAQQWNPR